MGEDETQRVAVIIIICACGAPAAAWAGRLLKREADMLIADMQVQLFCPPATRGPAIRAPYKPILDTRISSTR